MTRILRFLGYRPIVMLFDVAGAALALVLALAIDGQQVGRAPGLIGHRTLLLVSSAAVIVAFQLLDLYSNWLRCSRSHLGYCAIVASIMASGITVAAGFLLGLLDMPRSVLLWYASLQMLLITAYRLLGSTAYRHWFGGRKTVVIGETAESALKVAEEFTTERGLYAVQRCAVRSDLNWPFAELEQATTVVLADDVKQKEQLILHCFRKNKEVLIVPTISELTSHGADVRGMQDLLVFALRPHNFGPAESLVKRGFDLAGAAFLLILTLPVFVMLMILIPATSKGPIFFRQERLGRDRRRFHILKFRTMVPNAERSTGPVLATERDPRITRLGHVLRATRLDELPQLWNVLRGEMSLVGPRPERQFFVHQYEKILPAYSLRHAVKPGLTGLAQIKSNYSSSPERKLYFDLLYIYRHSLILDLKVVIQTIIVVLRGPQSMGVKREKVSQGYIRRDTVLPGVKYGLDQVIENRHNSR